MENLSRHIEYLLLRHDCVIVPGIGAFINIYHPPFFDKDSKSILPPKREIRFNPALKSDDGMLANSFARKLGITYREGSELLSRTIKNLGQFLINDKEITIGRLGIIRREEEGNLRFYPLNSIEKSSSDLGIIPIPYNRLTNSSDIIQSDSDISNTQEFKTEPQNINEITTKELDREILLRKVKKMDFDRNYYIPVNKLLSKICALLMVGIILCIACYNFPLNLPQGEERASVLPIDKVIDTAMQKVKDEKAIGNENISALNRPEDSVASLKADEDSVKVKENRLESYNEDYFLIVATCSSRKEAERYIERHLTSNFSLEIIKSSKFYRVSAKSSSSRQDLIDLKADSRFNQIFPKAWIWKRGS